MKRRWSTRPWACIDQDASDFQMRSEGSSAGEACIFIIAVEGEARAKTVNWLKESTSTDLNDSFDATFTISASGIARHGFIQHFHGHRKSSISKFFNNAFEVHKCESEDSTNPEEQGFLFSDFLNSLEDFIAVNDVESAEDLVFYSCDQLLSSDRFFDCDELIRRVESKVSIMPSSVMRAFLVVTFSTKSMLKSRKRLFERVRERMIQLRGLDKTKRLIDRLL